MGTKKGMKRKTARRAYKKKARRIGRGKKTVNLGFGLRGKPTSRYMVLLTTGFKRRKK